MQLFILPGKHAAVVELATKTQILEPFKGTRLLSESLSRLAHPPKLLISASAIGYYGDRGRRLNEQLPGSDFLARFARNGKSTTAASDAGIALNLRFGIVLSTTGGAADGDPFSFGSRWYYRQR
jgi:NAD dependent epimerase/dehydratase family enzyme